MLLRVRVTKCASLIANHPRFISPYCHKILYSVTTEEQTLKHQTLNEILKNIMSRTSPLNLMSKQEELESINIFLPINEKLLNKQEESEIQSKSQSRVKFKKTLQEIVDRKQGAQTPAAKKMVLEWFEPLVLRIITQQRASLKGQLSNISSNLFTSIGAEKLAILLIHEVFSILLMKKEVSFVELSDSVAASITAEINIGRMKKFPSVLPSHRRFIETINFFAQSNDKIEQISREEMIKIAALLIQQLIESAAIPNENQNKPNQIDSIAAFEHGYKYDPDEKKRIAVVRMSESLQTIFDEEVAIREVISQTRHLPMVIPPNPWTEFDKGGYLTLSNLIMRTRGSQTQTYLLRDSDLTSVFKSLNVLNETKWVINKKVFEVVKEVWERGGGLAALPSRIDNILPKKPSNATPEELKAWRRKTKKLKIENNNLHSLRCDMILKLKVAEDYSDSEFYFPHNVDFRGRAYPIPPHLNHLGSDLNRGLLKFSKSVPIGSKGIFWLKIHLANLCGQDKSSFDERIAYIDANIENIMDSCDRPLNGRRWWLKSENPWQTLASCTELTEVIRSPEPEKYLSQMPVQMDGSCNGLQHYAALGRDNLGALHVNLLPTLKPMDVYNGVLNVVKRNIEYDAKMGNPLARALNGNVYRNTIKQTVMTSVYGVTWVGAREQIQKRLKERKEIDEELSYKCACYLATITLKSLGEVFSCAKAIMEWLNELAHLISTIDKPVMWVTPLGLPVVQPYRAKRSHQVSTILQKVTLVDIDDKLPVNLARQKSAFPPNYVHSLDATHMLMTAIRCHEANITFAAVHDSFWTHAHDIDLMNELIRDCFIELHSQPLLENLLSGFREMYPEINFPDVPKRGTLDLERVKRAKYFFD